MKDGANNTKSYNNIDTDSIDIIANLKKVWTGRKLIIKLTALSFVIGCIVALTSPVIYVSDTSFVPQTSDYNSSSSKGIGSLASLAGINLDIGAPSGLDNYISPLLYSKILVVYPYLHL